MKLTPDIAQGDELCVWCGYPFDPGEDIFVWADSAGMLYGPYCSRNCANRDKKHTEKQNDAPL
ncbi:MAG: hypothetical protein KAU28_01210 [Phycisphaerae bacterium]|nr:hypothetical protein [Phycisphaerae bacterium]